MPGRSRRGRRKAPTGTLFASADAMVAVRLAKMSIAESQRALRDKAIFRPKTPRLPPEGRKRTKTLGPGATQTTFCSSVGDEASRAGTPRITKKYRRERPWLSAREVRERVREDDREARAGLRAGLRHNFGFNSTQTLTNPDFKMNLRSMKRIEGDKCVQIPRESMHLERVKLPPMTVVERPKPKDYFGYGDKVKVLRPPDALEFGCLKDWSHDTETVGKILIGGRRWNGDCLVELDGQRLWMKQDELQMFERSSEPRPTTAEELKIMNKRRAAERKRRMKAKRAAQLKYNIQIEEGEENTMATEEVRDFFTQIDVDGGGTLDTEEMKLLMKRLGQPSEGEGFASIMHELDADGSGEVDCEEFLKWWKCAGRERREEITRYNDKRREVREIFDEVDTDGSGEVDASEVAQLVQNLGVKMSPSELQDAMAKMDSDGSGEVEFEEFYHWWMSPSTVGALKKSREQMEAVRNLFDTLDDDNSGALSRNEVEQLAKSLGANLTEREMNDAMAEMCKDGSNEVDFMEFFNWWVGAKGSLLAQAKAREEKRSAMWKKVEAIDDTAYTSRRQTDDDVLNLKGRDKDNALRRRLEEQGGAGPRLRRCTVVEISATLGGGIGASDGDSDDDDQDAVQHLLQACEENRIRDAIRALEGSAHARPIGVDEALAGVTPLMVASGKGHVELVEELLKRGANPNLADLDDATAVRWAADAISGNAEETKLDKELQSVIAHLVAHGAQPVEVKDKLAEDGFSKSFKLDDTDRILGDNLLKAADNEEVKKYMLNMDVHTALSTTCDKAPENEHEKEIRELQHRIAEQDQNHQKTVVPPDPESEAATNARKLLEREQAEEDASKRAREKEEHEEQAAALDAKWASMSTPEQLFMKRMIAKEEELEHIKDLETPRSR